MSMSKKMPLKPWQDQYGNFLGDQEIRELGAKWDAETWDEYLHVTVEKPLKESQISPKKYDELCEYQSEAIFESISPELNGQATAAIRRFMRERLTRRQRMISEMYFWHGLSIRKIAARLGVNPKTVFQQKQDSLKKIKELMQNHPNVFPRVRGKAIVKPKKSVHPARPAKTTIQTRKGA